jgi:hypothetical protein
MNNLIDDLIKLAFAEDIGDGDHTTLCCIPADAMGKSKLLIKEKAFLQVLKWQKKCLLILTLELKMEVLSMMELR